MIEASEIICQIEAKFWGEFCPQLKDLIQEIARERIICSQK